MSDVELQGLLKNTISRISDCLLLRDLAQFYLSKRSEKAFVIFKEAAGRQCRDADFGSLSKDLGAFMAVLDYRRDKTQNPESRLRVYDVNTNWFEGFRKSYKRSWLKVKWFGRKPLL